ncbi:intradiol ring-cleavage dioxygenase [Streptomyces xiamenensis]
MTERENELSRRTILAIGGAGAAGLALAACSGGGDSGSGGDSGGTDAGTATGGTGGTGDTGSAQCVLTSNVTEGPYYLDGQLIRKDITDGKQGVPLTLRLTVQDATDSCDPVPGAAVEIWHCDAWGYYSGYTQNSPGGEVPAESADGSGADSETFLRGYQIADDSGLVEFTTIVPGWYSGRACHIHVKVHTGGQQEDGTYAGGTVNHTGQLFFADDLLTGVYALDPYSRHTGDGPMKLAEDGIYPGNGAQGGLLTMTAVKDGDVPAGYTGTLTMGIDPDAENDSGGGDGGPGAGGPGGGDGGPGGEPPSEGDNGS